MAAEGVSLSGCAKCSVLIVSSLLPFLSFLTSTLPAADGTAWEAVSGKVLAARVPALTSPRENRSTVENHFDFIHASFESTRHSLTSFYLAPKQRTRDRGRLAYPKTSSIGTLGL